MVQEIWEPGLKAVFVGTAVTELADTLGFPHLHPKDRFWELLVVGGISPTLIITPQERKALAEGHAKGNVSDPIRSMFIQKRTSQVLKLGVGLTDLNRRVLAASEKDKSARPVQADVEEMIGRAEKLKPAILAFVIPPELFVELFKNRHANVSGALGLQPFRIVDSEVWLLGSTTAVFRGEALNAQEDAFFALGEHLAALTGEAGGDH
jgi:G:T/U-mismatch repair DNA glycosylase